MQNMAEAGQLHKSTLILLFAAAKRDGRGAHAYGVGLCGFRLPQCPTALVDHGL
jgi:hypothetical protein